MGRIKDRPNSEYIVFKMPVEPNYDSLLDNDIKELFKGTTHMTFEPLLAQIIKLLRKGLKEKP